MLKNLDKKWKDLVLWVGTVILTSIVLFLVVPLAIVQECWGTCEYDEPGDKSANIGNCCCLTNAREAFPGQIGILIAVPAIVGIAYYLHKNKPNLISSIVIAVAAIIISTISFSVEYILLKTALSAGI